jgi:hypothetical protein
MAPKRASADEVGELICVDRPFLIDAQAAFWLGPLG